MIRFKTFIKENKKTTKFKSSPRLSDFLDHLMSVVVSSHQKGNNLQEVTLLDKTKPTGDTKIPKGKQVPVPDVLSHNAVTQRDSEEHAGRYKRMMENGSRIASEKGNVYKHMRNGFASYMEKYLSQSYGSKNLTADQKHHHEYRKKNYGYMSKPKNNFWMGKNTKIRKNEKLSENSTGLSLAPYTMHGITGHSSCVKATEGCRHSCLAYTTGQNAMLSNINSKIGKSQYMGEHPEQAAAQIHNEMLNHIDNTANMNNGRWHKTQVSKADTPEKKKATLQAQKEHSEGKRYTAGFRMNVTSDYHTRHLMGSMLDHVHEYAKQKGVEMKVRDYTKHDERLYQERPSYHFLALSHTGSGHPESNDESVSKALNNGHTVASIVRGNATHFYDHKTKRLFPITEGDKDDMIENRHSEVGHTVHPDGTGSDPTTGKKTGVVSVLRIKGISKSVKKEAGAFENQTTEINHPVHGKMNVVEINKPT